MPCTKPVLVLVPALASNNGAQPPNTFEADVTGVRAPLVAAEADVILLLHSWGGAVGSVMGA